LVLPNFAYSQRGILASGPKQSKGIPFLTPNAIEHLYGIYEFPPGKVHVRFTSEMIVPFAEWENRPCETTEYRLFRFREEPVFFTGVNEWGFLFFRFTGRTASPEDFSGACAFIERFIARFLYFNSLLEKGRGVSFPAVLEIREEAGE